MNQDATKAIFYVVILDCQAGLSWSSIVTNDHWRVNGGNRIKDNRVGHRQYRLHRRLYRRGIINLLPIREQSLQPTMERLDSGNGKFFAPDIGSGGKRTDLGPIGFWVTDLKGVNPLNDFSENGHWLYRKLVGLPNGLERDMLQGLAEDCRRDLQVAIEELKKFEFIDDTKPGELRLTAMKWIPYHKPE